ncbi:MAG: M6 family metalloprotease domain-containing protein, partial [Ignavibacteriales bacterium]|nr:M6 family metalloprotease domain-containing protein [Ignavibacteriales bacterium]
MNSKKDTDQKTSVGIGGFLLIILLLIVLISEEETIASVPPHHRIEKRIQDRTISVPYHLAFTSEARARGINAPMIVSKVKKDCLLSEVSASAFNALAIIVQFPDKPVQTSLEYFDTLLFHPSGKTLRKYYQEISYGQMDIVTVDLPSSTGWKQVSQNYSYYVDGKNGFGTYPNNSQKLVEDVVALADSIVDFSKYDNDHDGYVDALFIIHAGSGAEYTGSVNDIWSHQWSTYTPQLVDGVNVFTYSIEPEYWSKPGDMTCGVFAHEMAHAVFQLPDLYDYDQNSKGLGRWSLMASGSWNGNLGNSPAHPDAWSRVMMGFAQPTVIDSDIMDMEILPVEDVSSIYKLIPYGSTGNEYFLIENRRKKLFDEALRGEGLLVYHIDENKIGNSGQWYPDLTTNDHYKVALEQADGKWDLERNQNAGDTGDPFPGSTNKTIYNTLSIPNSNNYLDRKTNLAVTN